MLISTFGEREYDQEFNKDFTISVFYEGEEENKISRTWSILGWFTLFLMVNFKLRLILSVIEQLTPPFKMIIGAFTLVLTFSPTICLT